jgi:LssY C-terminus
MPDDDSDRSKTTPTETSQLSPWMQKPTTAARETVTEKARGRRRILVRTLMAGVALVVTWLLLAYLILPALWRHNEHHPALENAPKTTLTAQGIPGDPLNVGLIEIEQEIVRAMLGSGWDAADPVTLGSSIGIARSVLRDRPYVDAPVSSLFVFGRKQDFAFENASHRHHVRFWKSTEYGHGETPLWIGAVTYDRSVGLRHRTGQITHHIGTHVDAERNGLFADLGGNGWLTEECQVTGVGATLLGRNGGGDRYYMDGELTIGVLGKDKSREGSPNRLANPVPVQIKDQLWSVVRPLMQSLPGQ